MYTYIYIYIYVYTHIYSVPIASVESADEEFAQESFTWVSTQTLLDFDTYATGRFTVFATINFTEDNISSATFTAQGNKSSKSL